MLFIADLKKMNIGVFEILGVHCAAEIKRSVQEAQAERLLPRNTLRNVLECITLLCSNMPS